MRCLLWMTRHLTVIALASLALDLFESPRSEAAELLGTPPNAASSTQPDTNSPAETTGLWEAFSQGSYDLFYQVCSARPQTPDPAPNVGGGTANHTPSSQDDQDAAYLARLASVRAKIVDCKAEQVNQVTQNPKLQSAITDDVSSKIALLIELRHQSADHDASLAYHAQLGQASDPKSDYYKELKDQNQILAAEESVLTSIPMIELPQMQEFIRSQLAMYNDGRGPRPSFDDIQKTVSKGIHDAIWGSANALAKDSLELNKGVQSNGHTLSLAMRESLAQDTGLLESVVSKSGKLTSPERGASCRVDAKYGRGAKIRDNILLVGQVGLTAGGIGLKIVSRLATSLTSLRGAVAVGQVAARSANIVSKVALAANITSGTIQSVKACSSQGQTTGTIQNNACSEISIQEIKQGNCALTVALNSLGAAVSTQIGQKLVGQLLGAELKAPALAKNGSPTRELDLSSPEPEVHIGDTTPVKNPNWSDDSAFVLSKRELEVGKKVLTTQRGEQNLVTQVSADGQFIELTSPGNIKTYLKVDSINGNAVKAYQVDPSKTPLATTSAAYTDGSNIAPLKGSFDPKSLSQDQLAERLTSAQIDSSRTAVGNIQAQQALKEMNQSVAQRIQSGYGLTADDLKEWNRLANKGVLDKEYAAAAGIVRGTQRQVLDESGKLTVNLQEMQVGAGPFLAYIPANQVPEKLHALLGKVNALSPNSSLLDVAEIYQDYIKIHPFIDGNGRTARALVDYAISRLKLPPLPPGQSLPRETLYQSPQELALKIKALYENN